MLNNTERRIRNTELCAQLLRPESRMVERYEGLLEMYKQTQRRRNLAKKGEITFDANRWCPVEYLSVEVYKSRMIRIIKERLSRRHFALELKQCAI
jgi:hypothetical protein